MRGAHPFPRARFCILAWTLVFALSYLSAYPLTNFVFLCDLAVLIACLGFWRGSALLLSSQTISTLVVGSVWTLDLCWRAATGSHLIGGTEYMWDARLPLLLRSLSLYHAFLPAVLLWSLRFVGYDRRGLTLQSAIAVLGVAAGRWVGPEANINNAYLDPILGRSFGPAPIHMAVILGVLIGVVYASTHALLSLCFRPAVEQPATAA